MEKEKDLPGAGGQAPEGQAEGATATSPIIYIEDAVKEKTKKMTAEQLESYARKVYEKMLSYHSKFCDYPCFALHDVREYLIALKKGESFVLGGEGTLMTKSGTFGNESYSHFIDSCINTINEMR